eukprot:6206384-Pleurochrysis_carterae.AAC.5
MRYIFILSYLAVETMMMRFSSDAMRRSRLPRFVALLLLNEIRGAPLAREGHDRQRNQNHGFCPLPRCPCDNLVKR